MKLHEYKASYSGMVCGAMVLDADGSGTDCGLQYGDPVHSQATQARYDELAENIHIYYHLDATIDQDIREFEELHFLLGKDKAA